MKFAIALLAVTAWAGPVFAASTIADCPNDRGMVSVDDVQNAFAERSVQIVALAAKAEDPTLTRLVAPTFDFLMWEGDNGWSPRDSGTRQSLHGIAAMRELARHLKSAKFEFAIVSPGPIASDPCGKQSATVTFSDAAGDRAYIVRFDYLAGRLVNAEGRLARVTRGKVRTAR